MRSATSTPFPLPHQRKHSAKRNAHLQPHAGAAHASSSEGKSSGLMPAQAILEMESESEARLANQSRIETRRVEIRMLVEAITHEATSRCSTSCATKHAGLAATRPQKRHASGSAMPGRQLEVGLMMLDRARRAAN